MHRMPIVNGIAFGIGVGLVAWLSYQYQTYRQSQIKPHVLVSQTVLTPKIHVGEPLYIRGVVTRYRDCHTVVHRFVVDEQGVVIYLDMVPLVQGTIGENLTATVRQELPPDIKPGHYRRHNEHRTDCSDGRLWVETGDIEFDVIK